jgi:hypothetical protein
MEHRWIMALLVSMVTSTLGNFGYQALTGQHWNRARERSYFQGVALGICWLSAWLLS